MTAYIVDDDKIYIYTLKKLLQLSNIPLQVVEFQSANAALASLSNPENAVQLPDFIFLDINMPIMDGWDFMEEYEKIQPQLKKDIAIYMISSSINSRDVIRAKGTPGIIEYITKPLSERTLISLLGTATHGLN